MKILHIIETLSARYGGPARVLAKLAKEQAGAGHTVDIATTNGDYPSGVLDVTIDSTVTENGVSIHYFPMQFRPLLFSHQFRTYIATTMRSFDIVHVHGLFRFPPTYAAYYARKHRIPYIVRPFGSLNPYLYQRSTSGRIWLKRLYEQWFDLPNLRAAGAIHYATDDERDRATFLGMNAPTFVVPNGLDWIDYANLPERGLFRDRYKLGVAPVVLFLGRVHFVKGLDLLIPAFDRVRKSYPEARLCIVGPDNDGYGKTVQEWVKERHLQRSVTFIDFLKGSDVIQAYVDADVFVLPSYTENFGMTVVEAMACKVPVVISDQVNIQAEVAEAGAGLVTHCKSEDVATALETLLRDPDRCHIMGEKGRELVEGRFTWPRIVARLTCEYEVVIARSQQLSHSQMRQTQT